MGKDESKTLLEAGKGISAQLEDIKKGIYKFKRVKVDGLVSPDAMFGYSRHACEAGPDNPWEFGVNENGTIFFHYDMKPGGEMKSDTYQLPQEALNKLRKAFQPYKAVLSQFVVHTGLLGVGGWTDRFWFLGYDVGGWCLKNRKPEDFARQDGMTEEYWQDRQQDKIMLEMFRKGCDILHDYGFDITWDGYTIHDTGRLYSEQALEREMEARFDELDKEFEAEWAKRKNEKLSDEDFHRVAGLMGFERVKVGKRSEPNVVFRYARGTSELAEFEDGWGFDIYKNGKITFHWHDKKKIGANHEAIFSLPQEAVERLQQTFKPYEEQFPDFIVNTGLLGLDGWFTTFVFLGYSFTAWAIEIRTPEHFKRKPHMTDEDYQDRQQDRIMLELFQKGCAVLRDYGFDISFAGFHTLQ